MRKLIAFPILLTAAALSLPAQSGYQGSDNVPVGTTVAVRTNERIRINDPSDGRVFTGVVDQDVVDNSGRVVIPRGSDAELVVRNVSRGDIALDLESVTVNGRRYMVAATDESATADRRAGLGKNSRTGKYVGGGAVLGAIIGAIAGGGKGAAIGAAAGAGAGAGAQVLTRGKSVDVPAESVVTFRLDQPLNLREGGDRYYERNGRHYHYDR